MQRREAIKKTAVAAGSVGLVPTLMNLLQSCQQQDRVDWQPVFLSQEHAALVSGITDTILPKTETPGALELKVDIFIDRVLGEIYDQPAQQMMVSGLEMLQESCRQKFGKTFDSLGPEDRSEMISSFESSSGKFSGKVWGTAVNEEEPGFYRLLKSMILWGYFTSEKIGEEVLSYDPVPGPFKGCISLSEVGNAWSL